MNNPIYLKGYNFAIRYGTNTLTETETENIKNSEEGFKDIIFKNYNPFKAEDKMSLFNQGKHDAVEFMQDSNELINEGDAFIADFDSLEHVDKLDNLKKILEVCDNKEAMTVLYEKYCKGIIAFVTLCKKIKIKDLYDV